MSVEKTKSGWQARWRDQAGKQRAKTFKRKTDAVAYEAKMKTEVREEDFIESFAGEMTVNQLADQWLAASIHLAPGTQGVYRRDFNRYLRPIFGAVPLGKLTPQLVQNFLADELKAYSPSSVHRHYRTLHTMLNYAVDQSLIRANPCARVKAPRVPRKEMNFLTRDQVEALADSILPRYRAFILVAAYGGLRWGELVGLRRKSVDGARIAVTEQLMMIDGEFHRAPPKTKSSVRTVLLPSSIADELEAHMAAYTEPDPDALVFTNSRDVPIGHSFRHNIWLPACEKAGLAHKVIGERNRIKIEGAPTFHTLRHTAVTLAIAAGANPKAIQQRMGHSSIMVTMNTYGHLLDAVGEDLAIDLDRIRKTE